MDTQASNENGGCFDIIIEKGTFDSMFVDEKDPWNISQELEDKMSSCLTSVNIFS